MDEARVGRGGDGGGGRLAAKAEVTGLAPRSLQADRRGRCRTASLRWKNSATWPHRRRCSVARGRSRHEKIRLFGRRCFHTFCRERVRPRRVPTPSRQPAGRRRRLLRRLPRGPGDLAGRSIRFACGPHASGARACSTSPRGLDTRRREPPSAALTSSVWVLGLDAGLRLVAGADRGVRARRCDCAAVPTDASFDAVTAAFVLLHLGTPERAVAEAARVLRPGRPRRLQRVGCPLPRTLARRRRRGVPGPSAPVSCLQTSRSGPNPSGSRTRTSSARC